MNEHTNETTATVLAELVHRLRPEWDRPGILAAIENVAGRGRHPLDVAMAAIRLAATPEAKTPGALTQLDGPHWRERVSMALPPRHPKPHEACPDCGRHRDKCLCDEPPHHRERSAHTTDHITALRAELARVKTEEPTDA